MWVKQKEAKQNKKKRRKESEKRNVGRKEEWRMIRLVSQPCVQLKGFRAELREHADYVREGGGSREGLGNKIWLGTET